MRPSSEELVTDEGGIARAADAVKRAGRMGLDTEFMREKTYLPLLCLVQIAVPDNIFLVDTLAISDLHTVGALIADPDVEVVVHAGRQDFEIFYESYGVVPKNVFDIQVAAAFAGMGASLPYARLVDGVCGVSLAKGESYTHWDRRPLSRAQLHYAADDVRYLLEAADRLKATLDGMGRLGWARDELASLEATESYALDPDEVWRKVSGRGSLSPRQIAVLREVAGWREEAARARNLPRSWVVKDATLVEIARRGPRAVAELKSIRGLAPKEADRSGPAILEAVERGRDAEPVHADRSVARSVQQATRIIAGLADGVVRGRCEKAGIATELVATRAELEAVLGEVLSNGDAAAGSHRLLRGWRKDLAGDAVVALAQGKIAVRASRRAPYVEEVELREG